ncbi:MAG: hypothetical protein ABIZ09_15865 [Rhodoferax sp.]
MKRSILSGVCAAALLASAAATAGTVNVVFLHPETYTDARDWVDGERGTQLQMLSDYFQWLGKKYLPAEQYRPW